MNNNSKIKIILADDHPLMRQAIRLWLEKDEDMKVIAEARDGKEALDIISNLNPDIAILDISMPKLNGLETTRQIVAKFPKTKVLVFTVFTDDIHVQGMIQAGASGYLTKNVSGEEVVHAVRAVVAGDRIFDQSKFENDEGENKNPLPATQISVNNITPRELKILRFVANGLSNKDIAVNLGISLRGVKSILTAIYIKLGADSRTEAISIALKSGILSLNDLKHLNLN